MNFLNLLIKEKQVAGVEISDSAVRIAFLRPRKKAMRRTSQSKGQKESIENTPKGELFEKYELVLMEEPIAPNLIENGMVVDKAMLGKTLKGIWTKANLGTNYAIVSIPDDKIYSRIFSFPKTVLGSRLSEAMNLAISFQLPIKTESAYLDWESTEGTPILNEILFSTAPRTVVRDYIEAFETAGIKTLALESHLASIARAVKTEHGVTTVFTKKTPDGATIFAIKDNVLRFSRTLPSRFITEDTISAEATKILSALASETKGHIVEAKLLDAILRDDYLDTSLVPAPQSKWIVALGALVRGQIPEGKDNLISLLPVGTEEAYAYQKALTVASLVRNMTIGVSVFFVLAFLATYLFMFSLSRNTRQTVTALSESTLSPELLAQESRIKNVNTLTETAAAILDATPFWSIVVDEINARAIDGITISNFGAPAITEKMTISGTAKNRATLNQFKKSLQGSALFTEIEIPLTNLELKENIPFSTSFRIKDPSTVYYK